MLITRTCISYSSLRVISSVEYETTAKPKRFLNEPFEPAVDDDITTLIMTTLYTTIYDIMTTKFTRVGFYLVTRFYRLDLHALSNEKRPRGSLQLLPPLRITFCMHFARTFHRRTVNFEYTNSQGHGPSNDLMEFFCLFSAVFTHTRTCDSRIHTIHGRPS